MLYDLQVVERRTKTKLPVLRTDLVTSSKRYLYNRYMQIKQRKMPHRVIDQTGRILTDAEIQEMR